MGERTQLTRATRQPMRVVAGNCPACGEVVVVENHLETWPPVTCRCGWVGATDEIDNYVRRQRSDLA